MSEAAAAAAALAAAAAESVAQQQPVAAAEPSPVTAMDIRIGQIRSIEKHPDADSLYVEQVRAWQYHGSSWRTGSAAEIKSN